MFSTWVDMSASVQTTTQLLGWYATFALQTTVQCEGEAVRVVALTAEQIPWVVHGWLLLTRTPPVTRSAKGETATVVFLTVILLQRSTKVGRVVVGKRSVVEARNMKITVFVWQEAVVDASATRASKEVFSVNQDSRAVRSSNIRKEVLF